MAADLWLNRIMGVRASLKMIRARHVTSCHIRSVHSGATNAFYYDTTRTKMVVGTWVMTRSIGGFTHLTEINK